MLLQVIQTLKIHIELKKLIRRKNEMKKLFEIYEDNGRFIIEATDFTKTLLNQNQGRFDNLKGVDFKELDIPVEPSAQIFQICEVIRHVSNGEEFSRAFEQVALENKISENSVRDKCCR